MPSGASYAGPSSFAVSPGNTRITLPVRSQSGYINNYYIDVNSSVNCLITVSDGTVTPPVDPPDEGDKVVLGDTNGDGKISLIDLVNVQKHILGVIALNGNSFTGADTNKDGKISLIDLVNIQKHILGVIVLK